MVFSGKPSSWTIFTCGKTTVQRNGSCVQKTRVGAAHTTYVYNPLSDQKWRKSPTRKGQRHDLFRPRLRCSQDRGLLQAGGSYSKSRGLLRLKTGPSSGCHVRLAGCPAVGPFGQLTQPPIRSQLTEGVPALWHGRAQQLCDSRGGCPGLSVLRRATLNRVSALVTICP